MAQDMSFEDIRAMFLETDKKFQETDKKFQETDKKFQESAKEYKELRRLIKETDRQIGRLGNRLGDLIEHLIMPNIVKKFNALGYVFTRATTHVKYMDIDNPDRDIAEVDIMLENGEYALAVEVKTHLTTEDIKDHIGRMETLRRYADEHKDTRKYLGAVAGGIVSSGEKEYALKAGFYVIVQSGDTVKIERPSKEWKPKIW
jgi:hypothetical protein